MLLFSVRADLSLEQCANVAEASGQNRVSMLVRPIPIFRIRQTRSNLEHFEQIPLSSCPSTLFSSMTYAIGYGQTFPRNVAWLLSGSSDGEVWGEAGAGIVA